MISINIYEILMQTLNFGLLLWLLNKFLIKPLQKYLDERSDSIKGNIDSAKSSNDEAAALVTQQKGLLKEARVEAKDIREKTEFAAKKEHEEMISKTKEESKRLIDQ
ncbi:ATP synthase F0 subunit B, partial [Candidatus Marinamargulisbacteria bacterium SCGC AAA071-K20]